MRKSLTCLALISCCPSWTNNEACRCNTIPWRRVFLEAFAIDMLSPSYYYESSWQHIWVEAWSYVHGCRLLTMTWHTAKAPQEA